jgi:NADPH:quinone reductase-like Zn-dependent oxidoreductase
MARSGNEGDPLPRIGRPGALRLEEAESPSLEPHQVRIRVRAAGVNFADSLMVAAPIG